MSLLVPNVFSIVQVLNSKVGEHGFWKNKVWNWNIKCNQDFLIVEVLVEWMDIHNIIMHLAPISLSIDKFVWNKTETNVIAGVDFYVEIQLSHVLKIV